MSATKGDDTEKVPLTENMEMEEENTEVLPPPYHDGKVEFQPSSNKIPRAFNRDPPMGNVYLAVITIIFCCWPCGLIGLLQAIHAMQAHYKGEQLRADSCNKSSQRWSITSLVLGAICVSIYVLFFAWIGYRIGMNVREMKAAQLCIGNPNCMP